MLCLSIALENVAGNNISDCGVKYLNAANWEQITEIHLSHEDIIQVSIELVIKEQNI